MRPYLLSFHRSYTCMYGMVYTFSSYLLLCLLHHVIDLSETTGIYGFVTGLLLIFLAPGMFMKYLA